MKQFFKLYLSFILFSFFCFAPFIYAGEDHHQNDPNTHQEEPQNHHQDNNPNHGHDDLFGHHLECIQEAIKIAKEVIEEANQLADINSFESAGVLIRIAQEKIEFAEHCLERILKISNRVKRLKHKAKASVRAKRKKRKLKRLKRELGKMDQMAAHAAHSALQLGILFLDRDDVKGALGFGYIQNHISNFLSRSEEHVNHIEERMGELTISAEDQEKLNKYLTNAKDLFGVATEEAGNRNFSEAHSLIVQGEQDVHLAEQLLCEIKEELFRNHLDNQDDHSNDHVKD